MFNSFKRHTFDVTIYIYYLLYIRRLVDLDAYIIEPWTGVPIEMSSRSKPVLNRLYFHLGFPWILNTNTAIVTNSPTHLKSGYFWIKNFVTGVLPLARTSRVTYVSDDVIIIHASIQTQAKFEAILICIMLIYLAHDHLSYVFFMIFRSNRVFGAWKP